MAAKGGCIDFMFLAPPLTRPLDPLLNFPPKTLGDDKVDQSALGLIVDKCYHSKSTLNNFDCKANALKVRNWNSFLFKALVHWQIQGGGGARDTCPTRLSVQFLSISCILLVKKLPNNRLAHPL